MRSGRLKDKVVIQTQPDETDEYGEEVDVYETVFTAKCDFRIVSGTELLKADIDLNIEVATMLMRHDSRLQYDHSVLYKGNRYEVSSIKSTVNDRQMIVSVTRQVI